MLRRANRLGVQTAPIIRACLHSLSQASVGLAKGREVLLNNPEAL